MKTSYEMPLNIVVVNFGMTSGWKLITRYMDGANYPSMYLPKYDDYKCRTISIDGEETKIYAHLDSVRFRDCPAKLTTVRPLPTQCFLTIDYDEVDESSLKKIEDCFKKIQEQHPQVACSFVILDSENAIDKINQIKTFSGRLSLPISFVQVTHDQDKKILLAPSVETLFENAARDALNVRNKLAEKRETEYLLSQKEPSERTAKWHNSSKYITDRENFESIWNDPSYSTDKEKILALLSDYTKKDSVFLRFFTGHWNRHHVEDIHSIYVLGKNKDVKKILEDLNGIQLVNAKGTVATLREFLSEKIANPTQNNKTLLRLG